MLSLREVLDLWPSPKDLADDLGEKQATVQKWRDRNRVPAKKLHGLLLSARKRRFKVSAKLLIRLSARGPRRAV